MRIALVNESKAVSADEAMIMARMLDLQMTRDFCPDWELGDTPVTYYQDKASVPSGFDVMTIMDKCDDPNALGYHTENGARVTALIGVSPVLQAGGAVLWTPDPSIPTVLSVAAHEAMEMRGNPRVNAWVDGPEIPQGSQYCFEMCDAVESDSYEVVVDGHKGMTSSYLLQDWFDVQKPSGGKYDKLGKLTAHFTLDANGYMIVRQGAGSEQQVFGRHYPAWRWHMKQHSASRKSRITSQA